MCLAIPSKVVEVDKESNVATVDTMGVVRKASLDLIDEPVVPGDYVLLHIGYAMNKIDEKNALETLKLYEDIFDAMNEEEQELQEANRPASI